MFTSITDKTRKIFLSMYLFYRIGKSILFFLALDALTDVQLVLYTEIVFQLLIIYALIGIFGTYFANQALIDTNYFHKLFLHYSFCACILYIIFDFFGFTYPIFAFSILGALEANIIHSRYITILKGIIYLLLISITLVALPFLGVVDFLKIELLIKIFLLSWIWFSLYLYKSYNYRHLIDYWVEFFVLLQKRGVAFLLNAVIGMTKFKLLEMAGITIFGSDGSIVSRVFESAYSLSGNIANYIFVQFRHKGSYFLPKLLLVNFFSCVVALYSTRNFTFASSKDWVTEVVIITSFLLIVFIATNFVYKINSLVMHFEKNGFLNLIEAVFLFLTLCYVLLDLDNQFITYVFVILIGSSLCVYCLVDKYVVSLNSIDQRDGVEATISTFTSKYQRRQK